MKIEHFEAPFPYIRIFDLYNENELELMWKEFNFILHEDILEDPRKTGSAIDSKNKPLKKNKGIWLDSFYIDRNKSHILRTNRKVFDNFPEIMGGSNSWFFKNFRCNNDTTLISYYENGGYYKPHNDISFITILNWFYKEPKKFKGGDLFFVDYNIKIEIKNNSSIIFPSNITHSVSKISMDEEDIGKNYGRICMTQFGTIIPTDTQELIDENDINYEDQNED